jgi:hypothetical protein
MNNTNLQPYVPAELDALEARLAFRLTAGLTERMADLSPDVSERLRFAREQALARARAATVPEVVVGSGGTLSLGRGSDGGSAWWVQLAVLIPLIALVIGLVLIQRMHDRNQIAAAAEIDASLLADDLPPSAYSDPGFVEFLKAPRD